MARTQINFIKEPKNNHFCTIKWKSQGSCTLDVVSCRILNRAQWYLCRPVAFTNRLASTKSEWGFFSLIVQAISDTKRNLISFVCFLIWQRTMEVFGGLVLRSRIRFLHIFYCSSFKATKKEEMLRRVIKSSLGLSRLLRAHILCSVELILFLWKNFSIAWSQTSVRI